MPTLSRIKLTLAQSAAQVQLKTVSISYGYTISFTPEELEDAAGYRVSVDVLGDDLVRDDELALDVDSHGVLPDVPDGSPIDVERDLMVGQALLDEDLGEDEIKLRIVVRDDAGEVASAMTDVIRGKF